MTSIYSILEIDNLKYELNYTKSEIQGLHNASYSHANQLLGILKNNEERLEKIESDIFSIDWNFKMGHYK